jgi:hypothetical protein
LEHKNFNLMARDLSSYEQVTHERMKPSATSAIIRRLCERDTKREQHSAELLDLRSRGAVITAPSGYGKTVLARTLVYETIERRWDGTLDVLPIDLFLPDFVQSAKGLGAFLAERVAAHKAGFSDAMLKEIARDVGLLIVADGFERIEPSKRPWVAGQLRTLLADQPRTSVYIMSRAQAAPIGLGLPTLELLGYSRDELHKLAHLRALADPNAYHVFSNAPDYVYSISEIPLIADQVLAHYTSTGSYPTDLSTLFEEWLERILAESSTIDRALDRQLLRKIAVETADQPLDIARACELCASRSDPEVTLRRLAEQDAISVRGTTVELQPEALADNLRAVQFWASNPRLDQNRLNTLPFDPSSHFALLLVSAAPSADARREAWEAVARSDIRLAIRSLRFAGFDNPFTGEITEADSIRLARDLQSTIETLITSHLGPIGALLREEIAGQPVERLGVHATVGEDDIGYTFFDAADVDDKAVLVGLDEWGRAPRMYSHALRRMGFGPEAGRVLGVDCLKMAIYELVKQRSLSGGPIWTEERTFGRLRHLSRSYELPLDPTDFEKALDLLEPNSGEWVSGNSFRPGQQFPIDELLSDLRWLIDRGIMRMDRWWDDLDLLDLDKADAQQRFTRTIDTYYRRLQLAYNEVVEYSIPALRPHLRTLRTMPLRMEIIAEVNTGVSASLNILRWPVRSYAEAGADTNFSEEHHFDLSEEFFLSYLKRTHDLLAKLGRPFSEPSIQWSRISTPNLDGAETAFGSLPDESAIVSGSMRWLKEDLEGLFSEIPSGERQTPQKMP